MQGAYGCQGTYDVGGSGKRGGLNVRFAPEATVLLRRRETSRCANHVGPAELAVRLHLQNIRA